MTELVQFFYQFWKKTKESYYGFKYRPSGIIHKPDENEVENSTTLPDLFLRVSESYSVRTDYNDVYPDLVSQSILDEMSSQMNEIWIAKINNGRVITNLGNDVAIFNSKNQLFDILSFTYVKNEKNRFVHGSADKNVFYTKKQIKKPLVLTGKVFCMWTGGGKNFNIFHWFLDSISRLAILEGAFPGEKIDYYLLPALDQPYQVESLKIFGINPERVISSLDYPHVIASQLIVCSHPRTATYHTPESIAEFFKLKLAHIPHSQTLTRASRYLYISRSDAPRRKVKNENELADALAKEGFTTITISDFSFVEVINLFRQAQIVVSAHSAALTNMLFCSSGTWILELFPDSFVIPYYYELATALNLKYSYSVGSDPDNNIRIDSRYDGQSLDLIADVPDIIEKLNKMKINI